jgi:hypothetical protein
VQIIHCTARRKLMEQSLIEKMKNDTCDEIDKEMIVSRVLKAVQELQNVTSAFSESLENLKEQYADELKMAGATLVMGVAVPSLSQVKGTDFELLTEVIIGSTDNVDKALLTLMKDTK